MFFLWVLCGLLGILVVFLSIKIVSLKKGLTEMHAELTNHLESQSNTLISLSTRDRQVRYFAAALNKQLRLLRKQRQQYLNGDRQLKEAVTNISHDLRTPLTAICGYLELLEKEEKSAEVERYLSIISDRVGLLTQLTEELFHYSVIRTPKEELVKEQVILNEALEESIVGFYAVLKQRGIEPSIHVPQAKVLRQLNPALLSRVLANLLNNAIKYSEGDLDIVLLETGEIIFTNTTAQLDQLQVGKLFDRFYTVTAGEKSTGLGLEITRALVKQMDGHISADYHQKRLSIHLLFPEASNN